MPVNTEAILLNLGRKRKIVFKNPSNETLVPGERIKISYANHKAEAYVVGATQDKPDVTVQSVEKVDCLVSKADGELLKNISRFHFMPLEKILKRVKPEKTKSLGMNSNENMVLKNECQQVEFNKKTTLFLVGPLEDSNAVAAWCAASWVTSNGGKTLIICPTVDSVNRVCSFFKSGACKLDGRHVESNWERWHAGNIPIGVATRAGALWYTEGLNHMVVVEDRHPGLDEKNAPYTNARDLVGARCRVNNWQYSVVSSNPHCSVLKAVEDKNHVFNKWPKVETFLRNKNGALPAKLKEQTDGLKTLVVAPNTHVTRACANCKTPQGCPVCDGKNCTHTQQIHACGVCGRKEGIYLVGTTPSRAKKAWGGETLVCDVKNLKKIGNEKYDQVVLLDFENLVGSSQSNEELGVYVLTQAAKMLQENGVLKIVNAKNQPSIVTSLKDNRSFYPYLEEQLEERKHMGMPPWGRRMEITWKRKTKPSIKNLPGKKYGPIKSAPDTYKAMVLFNKEHLDELTSAIGKWSYNPNMTIKVS